MKTLPRSTSIHEQLVAVRLYRDDLERIVGLLRDAGLDVAITDSSFQYESFDDLQRAQGKSPRQLTIEGTEDSSPHSIVISKSGPYWYISSSGKEHYSLAREIELILRRRQSAVEHLPLHWMLQGANLVLWSGLVTRSRSAPASLALVAVGAFVLVSTLGLTVYWRLYSRVVLNYRHETGFLRRNRDAILLLLFGAVIGAIVHYLLSLFSGASAPRVAP